MRTYQLNKNAFQFQTLLEERQTQRQRRPQRVQRPAGHPDVLHADQRGRGRRRPRHQPALLRAPAGRRQRRVGPKWRQRDWLGAEDEGEGEDGATDGDEQPGDRGALAPRRV